VNSKQQETKLIKTITLTTVMLWSVHLGLFGLLFAGWLIRFVIQWFVSFGTPQRESSLESFLSGVMKVLTYPVRLVVADGQFEGSTITMFMLLAINGAIWGSALGFIVYAIGRHRHRSV
jgi:hypothetical protein